MSTGLSDSRFNMWRAVIALAHADGYIAECEEDFLDRYLAHVPFSEEQAGILKQDMEEAQDVPALFDQITDPADQGEFFEFGRMMIWCDGDLDAQEEKIFGYLKDSQMHRINEGDMQEIVRTTRDSERMRRAQEEEIFEKQAHEKLGLGAIITNMFR